MIKRSVTSRRIQSTAWFYQAGYGIGIQEPIMFAYGETLVEKWHDEGINQQNADIALELAAEDFQFHFSFITPEYPTGAAALRHWAIATFAFFPDFHVSTMDMVSNQNKVAFRAAITATHGGTIFGVPPTGKQLAWEAMGIFQIKNEQFAEFWWQPDLFSLMGQLGLVPD